MADFTNQRPTVHFKIAMIDRPPYFFKDETSGIYHGFTINTIEWLAQRLEFTYNITVVGNDFGEADILGKWSGVVGRMINNEFDLLGPPFSLTRSRLQVLDFVGLNDVGCSALLTPALTEQSSILSVLRPFQMEVWIMILISLLVVAFVLTLVSVRELKWKSLSRFNDIILYLTALLTNQGEIYFSMLHRTRSRWPHRLACASWCLMTLIMVNLYSSTLMSYITAHKMISPPKDAIQVMDEGIFSYLVLASGIGREIIMGANSGPLKKMGDILRRNPENLVSDRAIAFQKVASGCCAYSDFIKDLEYRTYKDYTETRQCRVTIGKPISGYGIFGMSVVKGNLMKSIMNLRLLELAQSGLPDYWESKYSHKNTPCKSIEMTANKNGRREKTVLHSLKLFDFTSAFFILALGYAVSFLIFLAEQLTRC